MFASSCLGISRQCDSLEKFITALEETTFITYIFLSKWYKIHFND